MTDDSGQMTAKDRNGGSEKGRNGEGEKRRRGEGESTDSEGQKQGTVGSKH